MNNNIIILCTIILITTGGLILYTKSLYGGAGNTLVNMDTAEPIAVPTVIPSALPLEPDAYNFNFITLNESGETGMVSIAEKDSKTVVALNILGVPNGTTQPTHIRSGSCSDPGKELYKLKGLVKGLSVTNLDLGLGDLKKESPLLVSVSKSGEDSNTMVVCADLTLD